MDLISREAAIETCIEVSKQEEEHSKMWATGLRYAKKILTELPSVPAVPLDKLCELLTANRVNIPCELCEYDDTGKCTVQNDMSKPCPNTTRDWRRVITKWMEGLYAVDRR